MAYPYSARRESTQTSWLWTGVAALCAAGLAGCITVLYLGSQFVMGEGGFVASGGPYENAHPAPEWVLLIPASIWVGFALGGLHMYAAARADGFGLTGIVWVGLFGVLGWGFFQAGFNPPGDAGIAWAWILCGVAFWAMALPVLVGVVGSFLPDSSPHHRMMPFAFGTADAERKGTAAYAIAHVLALPVGIGLGLWVWHAVTGL